jgi:hypothetical protein
LATLGGPIIENEISDMGAQLSHWLGSGFDCGLLLVHPWFNVA